MIDLIAFFIFGMCCGVALCAGMVMYLGKQVLKTKEKSSTKTSLSDRMKRVKEISSEQLELTRSIDGPQKNSLHGKHKNSLVNRLKALEEEKNDILRSIIADGYDPELTTVNESGVVDKMKLSEYMAYMGITMEPSKTKEKPKADQPKPSIERLGKFTVIKGGKSDIPN